MATAAYSYMITPDGKGDDLYAIETTYRDGGKSIRVYPTASGLRSGLSAVEKDIEFWSQTVPNAEGWVPASCRVLVTSPEWTERP